MQGFSSDGKILMPLLSVLFHLQNYVSVFWNFEVCNFIQKETLAQVFSLEFCEISKNTFFTEHHWTTASEKIIKILLAFLAIMF